MKYFFRGIIVALVTVTMLGCSNVQRKNTADWIGYTETGTASFYAAKHQYKKTASGDLYNQNLKTAAHRELPFGSKVKVTNTDNGKSVVVTVNDRGPFVKGRILDLSRSAFSSIGNMSLGLINVRLVVIE